MRRPPRRLLRCIIVPVALLCILSVAACRGGEAGPSSAARRYTVRGELLRLPAPDAKARQVSVRHEAIDDFVNDAGAVVGMDSMTMPFELAPAASTEGLAAGDKVELLLVVDWSRPYVKVERVRKLPDGTALEYRAARPPSHELEAAGN